MSDYTLGQRVRFAEHIKRTAKDWHDTTKPDRHWTGESYPGARHSGGEGIITGKRTLSDGNVVYLGEDGNVYEPTQHFTAYLIVTSLRSAPVHVLPEHITALEPTK
jgi:hypothetical protein